VREPFRSRRASFHRQRPGIVSFCLRRRTIAVLTVWVAAPAGTAGARLMTCISPWAATRLAARGSAAAKYFIMTKVLVYSFVVYVGKGV
jgi:hypothetical protein